MFLLFDIGGTNTRITVSRDLVSFESPEMSATPQRFEDGMSCIIRTTQVLVSRSSEPIIGIAGGIAGVFDKDRNRVINAPHLPQWNNQPFKDSLGKLFPGIPIYVGNDMEMAGLGEVVYGAGKGKRIVAVFTFSTGVGGARFVNGKLDVSVFGFEPGHQYIDRNNLSVDWEDLVSGSGLSKRYGKRPENIDDGTVWEEVEKNIAIGICNSIMHWSPEIVVLGGSLMKRVSLERIREYIQQYLTIFPVQPEIVQAELGDEWGIWGAMAALRSDRKIFKED